MRDDESRFSANIAKLGKHCGIYELAAFNLFLADSVEAQRRIGGFAMGKELVNVSTRARQNVWVIGLIAFDSDRKNSVAPRRWYPA